MNLNHDSYMTPLKTWIEKTANQIDPYKATLPPNLGYDSLEIFETNINPENLYIRSWQDELKTNITNLMKQRKQDSDNGYLVSEIRVASLEHPSKDSTSIRIYYAKAVRS